MTVRSQPRPPNIPRLPPVTSQHSSINPNHLLTSTIRDYDDTLRTTSKIMPEMYVSVSGLNNHQQFTNRTYLEQILAHYKNHNV